MRGVYTRIYKKSDTYQVSFFDPSTKDRYWSTFKSHEDALEKAFELDLGYHLHNPGDLPKGITLDKSNRRFRLHISVSNDDKKHVKSSRNLEELITMRKHIIMNLIGLL